MSEEPRHCKQGGADVPLNASFTTSKEVHSRNTTVGVW